MARSKTDLGRTKFESRAKYKHTHQGNGTRSLPKRGRKLRRGQGK